MFFKSLLCIFLLKCISYVQLTSVKNGHDFDLLIFTQQWPATECKEWKKNNPQHTCSMPKKSDTWTIHGIWPTKYGTIGPAFCNRTWLFDPEKVRPIEDQLTQVWVNIFGGTSLYSLWAHEWNKHGTCAAMLEPFNSELKYFSIGMDWLKKFSMTNILESSQIVPSNSKSYSVPDINKAIKDIIKVDPVIVCKQEDGKSYISEIRICFTKSLQNINCDGVVNPKVEIGGESILTNCKTPNSIVYPHYNNNKWIVELYRLVNWLSILT